MDSLVSCPRESYSLIENEMENIWKVKKQKQKRLLITSTINLV